MVGSASAKKTLLLLILSSVLLFPIFPWPPVSHASFWNNLFQPDEKKPQRASEGIIRETKERPVTPSRLGMEIQSVSNELEYYKKEIEARKRDKEELARQRSRPEPERKEIEKVEADLRAKQQIAKDLERELVGLKKRLRVLYLSYFYRFILVLGVFGAAYLLTRAARILLRQTALEGSRRQQMERLFRAVLFLSASILTIFIGLENLAHVAAVLGLALAGSAIALKDVFTSFIGWLMLNFTRQIKVGDFIETGGVCGKVLEVTVLKITIAEYRDYQETGRIVHFGNNLIFSRPLFNYTPGGYVWDEIKVRLTPQSDWKAGYDLLLELLKGMKWNGGREMNPLGDSNPPGEDNSGFPAPKPMVQATIESQGILLSVRYPTRIQSLVPARNEMTGAILNAFAQEKRVQLA